MDDFEIEVTPLTESRSTADADAARHPDGPTPAMPPRGSSPLVRRLGRRQHVMRALLLIALALLPLVAILGASAAMRARLDALFHPVTAFADSTDPAAEEFDLVHVAPWGTLRFDGLTVATAKMTGRLRAVRLAPGVHTLDYNAPPFAPLHCTVSVPADTTRDTCPFTHSPDDIAFLAAADSVRMLDLKAGFTNLSRAQLASLTLAARAGLVSGSPSVTVAPGEHYLAAPGAVSVATYPLRATFVYHLTTDDVAQRSPNVLDPATCRALCFYRALLAYMPGEWGIVASVALSWHYVAANGVATDGPANPDDAPMDTVLPLHVSWHAGWYITPLRFHLPRLSLSPFDSPICVPAAYMAGPLARTPIVPSGNFTGSASSLSADDGAAGCLIVWRGARNPSSGENGYGPPNYLLYRFGVVLAANAEARRTFPTLPLADPSEQALARALASL